MPIPSSINDLSTTPASNSPAGSESPTLSDDYLRYAFAYIASLRDVVLSGTANLSTANLTYTGTLTGSTGVLNIGSGQIYKDASGNTGVGTTNPVSYGKFAVVGTGDVGNFDSTSGAAGVALFENGTGRARIRTLNGSAGMAFLAGVTEALRIDSSCNVGIGVAAPTAKLDVNSTGIRIRSARTPLSATDTGNQGDICWDGSYIYVCISANTWKRSAISTW